MRRALTLLTAVLTCAAVLPAQPALAAIDPPVVEMGVVGCTKTRDAIIGFSEAGHTGTWDELGDEYNTGDVKGWAERPEFFEAFDTFLANHPDTTDIWWQICIKGNSTTSDVPTTQHYEWVDAVYDELVARVPAGTRIWASPQSDYEPVDLCMTTTSSDTMVSEALVAYAIAEGYAMEGPNMVTLTESLTLGDNCFASSLGRTWWGNQLEDFFDPGGDSGTGDPDDPSDPVDPGDPGPGDPGDPSGRFVDDDGNTHEGMIEAIAVVGITNGCDAVNRLYCPTDNVTRAQMASFIARSLGLPDTGNDFFVDDDGSTHEANINKLAGAGITLGCNAGGDRFCPNDQVTREQMASFLARAFNLTATGPNPFTDVSGTHLTNVIAIAEDGITLGCDATGTVYCPTDPVRRDQMASFLGRALDFNPLVPG